MKFDAGKINSFYDRGYDWIIARGPAVILGLVILFAGL